MISHPVHLFLKTHNEASKNHCSTNLTISRCIKHSINCSALLQNLQEHCPLRAEVHHLCSLYWCTPWVQALPLPGDEHYPPGSLLCPHPLWSGEHQATGHDWSSTTDHDSKATSVSAWGHTGASLYPSIPPTRGWREMGAAQCREDKGLEAAPPLSLQSLWCCHHPPIDIFSSTGKPWLSHGPAAVSPLTSLVSAAAWFPTLARATGSWAPAAPQRDRCFLLTLNTLSHHS